jgi:hypothetical protein
MKIGVARLCFLLLCLWTGIGWGTASLRAQQAPGEKYAALNAAPQQAQQRITITGTVLDSITGERLGYITLQEVGTTNGTMTDDMGTFRLETRAGSTLRVQCVGYRTKTVYAGKYSHNITVRIAPSDYEIKEVVVKPKRERYRRKDNPSVELAKNVIAHKGDYALTDHDYYRCERYDKMTYSFNNFDEGVQKMWKKKFQFIENYVDTAVLSGSPILPISTDERIETRYYRRQPELKRTVIEGIQHAGLDDMFPNELVQLMKTEVFPEVDLNENDIYLFTNKFVSPLSSMAVGFYKFYILDTVQWDNGERYVDLGFAPLIPESFGFIGHLFVSLDSTFFVRQAVLNVPPDINLNFVRTMRIVLDYDRLADSTRVCRTSTFDSEMNVTQNTMGLYAHRTCAYSDFRFEPPTADVERSVYGAFSPVIEAPDVTHRSETYWAEHRVGRGVPKEKSVASMLTEMRGVPLFYYGEKVLTMLFKGYVPVGSLPYEENKFLVGPLNTTVSHNSFEGWRFRTGGITTAALNRHWFGFGYVAYGLKDNELKGEGRVEYSFQPKKMHANEFPVHSLRARYNYDTKLLGQEFSTSKDNFLLSVKRDDDEKITYERTAELTYTREFWNGFSYYVTLAQQREYATHLTRFEQVGTGRMVGHYDMTTATINLRFAHNERFLQSRTSRIPVNKQTPVFSLTHTMGVQGLAGSDFDYQRTEFKFSKRFWMSAFGYIDTNLKAGKVWTSSPYTMLCLPSANLAYTIQDESFAQMNAMEFVNDQYASWDLVYFLNGCVFNAIPLLRRLKWREVVSFRGLIGSLSDRNDPTATLDDGTLRNPDLYYFPSENTIYKMGHTPYMEFAAGVENIFKCLRVDYIRRLNYLDHANVQKNGVQLTVHLTF